MDLRFYYEAIRGIEAGIVEAEVVVVSCETSDGGRGGVKSTVPRKLAARMIVEGLAVLESEVERG